MRLSRSSSLPPCLLSPIDRSAEADVPGTNRSQPLRRCAPMTKNELVGEIAECLEEALQLQSRVTEVTERAHRAAGMSGAYREVRGEGPRIHSGLLGPTGALRRSRCAEF